MNKLVKHWANAYIGIPYKVDGRDCKGLDCYGLVYHVLKTGAGIPMEQLPEYLDYPTGEGVENQQKLSEMMRQAANQGPFVRVQSEDVQPFDIVAFRTGVLARHLGIMVDKTRMLHVELGTTSLIESIDSPHWNLRLLGFWRHKLYMECPDAK